jgi:hypothetical protein
MRFADEPRGRDVTSFAPAAETVARTLVTMRGPSRGPIPFSSMPT